MSTGATPKSPSAELLRPAEHRSNTQIAQHGTFPHGFSMGEVLLVLTFLGFLLSLTPWLAKGLEGQRRDKAVSELSGVVERVYAHVSPKNPKHRETIEALSVFLKKEDPGPYTLYADSSAFELQTSAPCPNAYRLEFTLKESTPKALFLSLNIPPYVENIPVCVRIIP